MRNTFSGKRCRPLADGSVTLAPLPEGADDPTGKRSIRERFFPLPHAFEESDVLRAEGLDEEGALLLRLEDGTLRRIVAGERLRQLG